ncbi:MAG: hypothetical protein JO213_02120 [Alphaproteobacteria bacterium]|nr:hypothetical protein [Alphaproteobacteria bacterium]
MPFSIVVLPFSNLGGEPQQDYFVDGITESLTTDLSRALPGSFVVARGTAFTYKGKPIDAREIGHDLNVRYVLQGSVLADGEQVRVNARLIEATSKATPNYGPTASTKSGKTCSKFRTRSSGASRARSAWNLSISKRSAASAPAIRRP